MSTLRVNTLQDATGSNQPAMVGAAKAWVNFQGTGTVAIRAAFNVSSISDNGTGDYVVNFTNAMSDANYCTVCGGAGDATGEGSWNAVSNSPSTSGARVRSFSASGNAQDQTAFLVAIFR